MSDKAYKKDYYQKNKSKIKARSKARYEAQKEQKASKVSITTVNDRPASNNMNTFFSIDSPSSGGCNANNVIDHLNGWIYSCAQINASAVASQDLRLYATVEEGANNKFLHKHREVSRDKFEYIKEESSVKSLARVRKAENVVEIVDHPVLELLDTFNNFNNNFESFELTSTYLDMIGDAYWWVRKDDTGLPYEIWVLQGQYMRIVPAKTVNTFIKGYLYGKGKDIIKFNRDEIIHFKTPNPNSLYYGKGAAEAVIDTINRLDAMDKSETARLRNMGRPDFVVNYKNGKLDPNDYKKTQRMWDNTFGGPSKDGKVAIMDQEFDIKELGFSPKDMEYLNGRTWSLKQIGSAFSIPYSMLDSSEAKKATSEIAERVYGKLGILPRISRIAEKLTEKLLPMYDDSNRMFFMYDNPVPADKKLILEENIGYTNAGLISVNEARVRMGMTELEGEEYNEVRIPNWTNIAGNTSDRDSSMDKPEPEDTRTEEE